MIGHSVHINRSTLFNPSKFMCKDLRRGLSIWKGPVDGDGLSGLEDQDERSLALTELDLSKVQLVTCLQEDETSIQSEENLKRLKVTNHIRLDVQVFQTLWENQHFIPESWKEETNGKPPLISFDGTILRSPCGGRNVICLYYSYYGEWDRRVDWLECDWRADSRSAVLVSSAAETLANRVKIRMSVPWLSPSLTSPRFN